MTNNGLAKTSGNLFPAIPSLLDDLLGRNWLDSTITNGWTPTSNSPAVNIRENSDDLIIEVAVPGLKRKDFTVEVHDNVLMIAANRDDSQEKNHGSYTRREFNYYSFKRSFALPDKGVSADGISAKYVDGILRISIPKTEDAKTNPAKQIAVS
jgi:HSP20 family protein